MEVQKGGRGIEKEIFIERVRDNNVPDKNIQGLDLIELAAYIGRGLCF